MHTQAYDLGADVFRRGEHDEVFSRLRAQDPVHWYDDGDSHPYWCLTKHSDVQMANRDVDTFTVTGGFTLIDSDSDPLRGAMMGEMLPGMGPGRHTRYRRIVNRGFTPRTLRLLEDHLAYKAKLIVDGVAGRDDFEFVENVASQLPLQAICELVGVAEDDRNKIVEWSKVMTGIDDPNVSDQEAGMIASAEMIAYADELRIDRLSMPREDIITKLTNAQVGEDALSESEFGMFFILLVVAGNETTRMRPLTVCGRCSTIPISWCFCKPIRVSRKWSGPSRRFFDGRVPCSTSAARLPATSSYTARRSEKAIGLSCGTPRPTGTRRPSPTPSRSM